METPRVELYSLKGKKVFVAGHRGMVGSALLRRLDKENCAKILTATKDQIDLRLQNITQEWMYDLKPDVVFLSAAKAGGIVANNLYPVDFLYDNLTITTNVLHAACRAGVEKLIFLGSSCIYPKFSKQPIEETELLSGPLEPTNQWHAIAKIAGIKLCQAYRKEGKDFIVAMPTSLYGPGDNFNETSSHVIPALIRKVHHAKVTDSHKITVWGSGTPQREFLYVDDCADALIHLTKYYSDESPINIGYGKDITISELTRIIMEMIEFNGSIEFDKSKPDGTPRKLLCSRKIKSLGWAAKTSLQDGIKKSYEWFLENILENIMSQSR